MRLLRRLLRGLVGALVGVVKVARRPMAAGGRVLAGGDTWAREARKLNRAIAEALDHLEAELLSRDVTIARLERRVRELEGSE